MKKTILFLCTHNSARSQIAEGLINKFFSENYTAYSAGTEPGKVNPFAIEAMKEIGADISSHNSKSVDEFNGVNFNYVVTVCDGAKESCPTFPNADELIHKSFKDPSAYKGTDDDKLKCFRNTTKEIKTWLTSYFS